MENFVFQSPTKIIFGKDTEMKVGQEVRALGTKVLLHYGGGSVKKYGLYDRVVKSLKDADVDFMELGGVQPNPRLSLVREGIELCRKNDIDLILAVGGGSVIDSSKAIAVGTPYDGDVWDFYSGKAEIKEALPVGVVLTIPAAGSEASDSSVITNEDGMYKWSIGSDLIRPKFAIMNPEITYTLPPYQTVCGVADIMAHVMERYFTNTKGVDFTDRLCEATLKTVIANAPLVLDNPRDYNARAQIMWASTIAHNGLLSTGRVGDWASHKIEHELSALYDVPHGAGLAVVFPAWMKYVYGHNIDRFVQFAVRVWNVEMDFENPERTAIEGIRRLEGFFSRIGLPITLKELGIEDDRLEEMADRATKRNTIKLGNFVKLDRDDVLEIYKLAR